MNKRPFIRKIIYLAAIVVLLAPLSLMSMPARRPNSQDAGTKGGVLAQLREKHKLSQANLGEIDPTSETIKLATLGMRGVATYALWNKANEYKLKEDWTKLKASLEQITKLQPNFPSVWEFEAWNLAYNISAQFDDYRDRYFWHMEGIRFLQDGIRHNETAPRLPYYLGWIVSYKLGRADEHLQFRRLFREDTEFNGKRPIEERDNWLVGRQFHLDAEAMAARMDGGGVVNPLMFFSRSPMCLIDYATALEEEGVLDEKAGNAWDVALNSWKEFGDSELRLPEGSVRMNSYDEVRKEIEDLNKRMNELPPGNLRVILLEEKRAKLADTERAALDKAIETRTPDEVQLAARAEPKLNISSEELAERVDPEYRAEAKKLASSLNELSHDLRRIESNRNTLNYEYWLIRSDLERRNDTLEARRLTNQAERAFEIDNDLPAAQKLYDQAFAKWNNVLEEFPTMRESPIFNEDMMVIIRKYRVLLERLDIQELPENFPLHDIINAHPARQ